MSHRQFCEHFLAATRSGEQATLAALLHPDFAVEEAAGLPYACIYRGLEGWLALSRAVVATWRGFRLELLEYVAEAEDNLVVRFAISGRSRKTDRPFESSVLELWRFQEGKLFRILPYYFDTHLLAMLDTP